MSIIYSYDIFDTIITRRTADPYGVFALMQDRLQEFGNDFPTEVKENFFELRTQAERLARQYYCKDENEDISLLRIYHALNNTDIPDKASYKSAPPSCHSPALHNSMSRQNNLPSLFRIW